MTGMLLPFAHVWGLTLLLAALFAGAGMGFYRIVFVRRESENPFYIWGLSYFLGLFLYLFLLRLFAVLLGSATVSCYLALLVLAVVAALSWRSAAAHARRVFPAVLLLTAVYTVTTLTLWTESTLEVSAGTGFGSGHSGRYANIGIFMAQENVLPQPKQNHAQGLLAGTHLLLGAHSPLAALTAWLAVSLAHLSLFLYGLFRPVLPTALQTGLATFLFLGCNVSLSLTYVCLFSNGSPIMFMPYTDMVAAVATCVVFLTWLQDWVCAGEEVSYRMLLLPAVLGVVWNWCSPENIVTVTALCGVLVLLALVRPAVFPRQRLLALSAVFGLAVLAGATQGGMLMFKQPTVQAQIPGMESFSGDVAGALRWALGLEFAVSDGFITQAVHWSYGRSYYPAEEHRIVTFGAETALWLAVRMLFFPLVGILGVALLAVRRSAPRDGVRPEALRLWAVGAGVVFLVGFLIAFCFGFVLPSSWYPTIWESKWDLGRFLMPGVALGLVCLVLLAQAAAQGVARPRVRTALWVGLAVLGTFGPLGAFARTFRDNVLVGDAEAPWRSRLELLFDIREMLPNTLYEVHLATVASFKSDDVQKRRQAVRVIGRLGPDAEGFVEDLTPLLEDVDAEVRRLTAQALVKIRGAAAVNAVPALVEALDAPEPAARQAAAEALGKIGPEAQPAVSALSRLVRRARGDERRAAVSALVLIQGSEAAAVVLPRLIEDLKDYDAPVRRAAAGMLALLGPAAAPAADLLTGLLRDADKGVRQAAAFALVQIHGSDGAAAVLPVLVEALGDADAQVRHNAAANLGLLGPAAAEAADTLALLLGDGDEGTRRATAFALVQIKGAEAGAAVPVLIEGLKDPRPEVRQMCAGVLGQLGPAAEPAIEALSGLAREAEGVREAAAEALKKIQPKEQGQ